jgi:hypothetical protein
MIVFSDLPFFQFNHIVYRVTHEIQSNLDQDTMDSLMANAEAARMKRGIEIRDDQMYMIRFQHPPNPRLIAVVMIEDMQGERWNVIAYYDEIGHLLQKGWESGDIKKLPGSPFA